MKLATQRTGGDGRLLIVSRDLTLCVPAAAAPTLQSALDQWDAVEPALTQQYEALNHGAVAAAEPVDRGALDAIMPRAFQFLDASAFLAHNHILAKAWGFEPRAEAEPPLMYQGLSNIFYAPNDDVPFRGFADDVDFEAEFGVLTDAVPLGISTADALGHARLIMLINDWSLRAFGPDEMKGGFGFLHAKPPSSLSAFAMTPDELGDDWRDGRVCLPLAVHRNGAEFGRPNGAAMHFSFGELIAHAAMTRNLSAGTVIGSGTVSNHEAAVVGSACIAERRALDALNGRPTTPYLSAGENIRIELSDKAGQSMLGALDQKVVTR